MRPPFALELGDVRGSQFVEGRVALVEDRPPVSDPVLRRRRRELLEGEGGDVFVAASGTASDEQQSCCGNQTEARKS
jgi:hypothetical protein